MNRKQFLQNGVIIGGATILPTNSLLAATVRENGIDKSSHSCALNSVVDDNVVLSLVLSPE